MGNKIIEFYNKFVKEKETDDDNAILEEILKETVNRFLKQKMQPK